MHFNVNTSLDGLIKYFVSQQIAQNLKTEKSGALLSCIVVCSSRGVILVYQQNKTM